MDNPTGDRQRPSEQRVPVIERVAAKARQYSEGRLVAPIHLTATLAHAKPVSKAIEAMSLLFFDPETMDPRLREIVILRTGWNTAAVYEWGQHVVAGRKVGLTDDEIRAIGGAIADGPWTALEAAALQSVDDLCDDDCVGDAAWTDLEAQAGTELAIAIVALCGYYRMVAGVLNSLGVQPEDDLPRWPDSW